MKKKIIIILSVVFVIILSALAIYNTAKEPQIAELLYEYRDTYIGDASRVRKIVDIANMSPYIADSISLQTEGEPMKITVNFKVENRADHRHIDEEALNKTSALIFSLVHNADEIVYLFFDDYKDVSKAYGNTYQHDRSFMGFYYNRNFLYERPGMGEFFADYISNATQSIENFEQYYNNVINIKVPKEDSLIYDAVNEIIGNDCEIIANSGISTELVLDSEFFQSEEYGILRSVMAEEFDNTIHKHDGKTATLLKYVIRNFKTDDTRKCVFLYYLNDVGNVTMIDSEYLENDDEINAIRSIISR